MVSPCETDTAHMDVPAVRDKPLSLLQTRGREIITAEGSPVHLRGVAVTIFNKEGFIQKFPGVQHKLYEETARKMGKKEAHEFFEEMDSNFVGPEDIRYIRDLGANVIRLPLNYRMFEDDREPGHFKDSGFAKVDKVVDTCAKNGIYTILDLHAAPGGQNTDWHSDNAVQHALLWDYSHFQDRTVALWEKIAAHYKGNPAVAMYDLLNEPATEQNGYQPDLTGLSTFYARIIDAIRKHDPEHICTIEGDVFGGRFRSRPQDINYDPDQRFILPPDDNLVIQGHNYSLAQCDPVPYPNPDSSNGYPVLNYDRTVIDFTERQQGYGFAKEHDKPYLAGEFGAVISDDPSQLGYRVAAVNDVMRMFNQLGVHWTQWTYKEGSHLHLPYGSMGLVSPTPDSAYMAAVAPTEKKKLELRTDWWGEKLAGRSAARDAIDKAADAMYAVTADDPEEHGRELYRVDARRRSQTIFNRDLQVQWAERFADMTVKERGKVLESWRFENCVPNTLYVEAVKRNLQAPR